MDNIVKKAGKRLYMYVISVKTNLPQYLSDNIEVIQNRALKCIFPELGYAEILRRVNLDTLNVRRDSICQKYFDKI